MLGLGVNWIRTEVQNAEESCDLGVCPQFASATPLAFDKRDGFCILAG